MPLSLRICILCLFLGQEVYAQADHMQGLDLFLLLLLALLIYNNTVIFMYLQCICLQKEPMW